MIYRLATHLTDKLIRIKKIVPDQKDVYLYAFETLFSQVFVFLLVIAVALLLNGLSNVLTYIVFLILLRGQTSGYHANTTIGCAIVSLICTVLCIYFTNFFYTRTLTILFVVLLLSLAYILHNAPINHVNLNLSSFEQKEMRRKIKFILMLEILCICILYIFPFIRKSSIAGSLAIITVALFMVLSKILKQEVKQNV